MADPQETFDARLQRMRTALSRRLGHVQCALEALYHRHNVSAILRTCDALGVYRIHLVEGHFRATRGAARGAERWLDLNHHEGAERAVAAIRASGAALWVADLDPGGVPPEKIPLDRPVCLWFGAELEGVSPVARAAADGVMTLPMRGFTQSLNVSVAAALCLRPVAERARALGEAAFLPPDERAAIWARWVAREEAARTGLRARAGLSEVEVRQVGADVVIPLRHAVLRPGRPVESARWDGDDEGRHWAATRSGEVVGVATVLARPFPGADGPRWQLRGMATAPEVRGMGVGRALLLAVARDVGEPLWCNARVAAEPFYARNGWVVRGAPFEVDGVGPHVRMTSEPPHDPTALR